MPFYLITGGNKREGFFHDVEFYNNEEELKISINKMDDSWKPKSSLIDTYLDFIYCHCNLDSNPLSIIIETKNKYGDLLIKEFPNQFPMNVDELNVIVEKIEEYQSEMYEDALDALDNSEIDESSYNEGNSDWQQTYYDETGTWDRETGSSWRAENDFG